jgi:hypothetical protein
LEPTSVVAQRIRATTAPTPRDRRYQERIDLPERSPQGFLRRNAKDRAARSAILLLSP